MTYFYTGGTATVTVTRTDPPLPEENPVVLSSTVLVIDGVFATFDETTIDLSDFLFTLPQSAIIDLDQIYGGYDQFRVESASLTPGVGYSTLFGAPAGPGQYTFLSGPTDIDGVYSAFDTTLVKPDVNNAPVPFTDTSLINGSINVNTGVLQLTGITLTQLDGSLFGETDILEVKADIVFTGAVVLVPEPGTGALLGLGLVAVAWRRRVGRR